ncbi:MAG: flagellar biosynthesis chaperone FliJ [Lentisphaeria bacterium]|jgi:flagellar biosynthesis chaperone FliJ
MSKKALEVLIKARSLAEEKAELHLAEMRREYNTSKDQLQEKIKTLNDFRNDCTARQEALFRQVELQQIKVSDLAQYRDQVYTSGINQHEFNAEIDGQKELCCKAEDELTDAKKQLDNAKKASEKLRQHMQIYDLEEKQQQERDEEDVLDEFSITKRVVKGPFDELEFG